MSRSKKSRSYVGYKVRREKVFLLYFYILRYETEGIVWGNRRRVEGKVLKTKTHGNNEKIQINMIMHIGRKTGRPQANLI